MWLNKVVSVKLKELKPRKNITWTKKQIEMSSNVASFYDTKKGIISISKDNEVLDGNHRYLILLKHYGGEHEIEVKKKRFGRKVYTLQTLLLVLIFLPIFIPYAIIYTIINKDNKKQILWED